MNMDAEKFEYTKEYIINTLVRRDKISREEAEGIVESVQRDVDEMSEIGDFFDAEELIERELGLEPEFLLAFIF
jgi:hypothetical protein